MAASVLYQIEAGEHIWGIWDIRRLPWRDVARGYGVRAGNRLFRHLTPAGTMNEVDFYHAPRISVREVMNLCEAASQKGETLEIPGLSDEAVGVVYETFGSVGLKLPEVLRPGR